MSEALAAPLLGDPHPAAKKVRELEQDGASMMRPLWLERGNRPSDESMGPLCIAGVA